MKVFIFMFLMSAGFLHASSEIALSMVPRSKLVEEIGKDFILRTQSGTKVHIEFTRTGILEEAKGKNLGQGDEFEPGDGLISLGTAARSLEALGMKPTGLWNLEKDPELGWVYEIQNVLVDARDGKILKSIGQ
jgi:hypothetical protein